MFFKLFCELNSRIQVYAKDMVNTKFRLPDPHQAQIATMMESSMAPCGSGILPLLVCQSPRWRFNKVPLSIPRGSGNLNLLWTIS
jgi:hypothetical protein